jgi:hypothetical protein
MGWWRGTERCVTGKRVMGGLKDAKNTLRDELDNESRATADVDIAKAWIISGIESARKGFVWGAGWYYTICKGGVVTYWATKSGLRSREEWERTITQLLGAIKTAHAFKDCLGVSNLVLITSNQPPSKYYFLSIKIPRLILVQNAPPPPKRTPYRHFLDSESPEYDTKTWLFLWEND